LTHYGHKNICRGTSIWKIGEEGDNGQNTRDFDTLEEMNYALVKGINDSVGPDDELWHLGDWSFGGVENIIKFRSQLICQNINLVFGNHDQHIESGKYLTYMHKDDGITSKSPITGMKDCFKSTQYYKELSIEGHRICLLHYAMRVFNKSHKGAIHLYGHSHDTLPGIGKSMDVGVDVAFRMFGEYRPFSWPEIQKIMAKKEVELVDHHSKTTN
jgi:calcineurin-like phosphoesterase family protein